MRVSITFSVCVLFSLSVVSASQLWSGSFDYYSSSSSLNAWSWDNQVGPYQTYISGPNSISDWISLDSSFKNPADTSSKQGARFLVNGNAIWATGGTELRRTELIPEGFSDSQQTGTIFYQWSMKQTTSNQLLPNFEHQLVFFENHACDIKYGGEPGALLYFYVNQQVVWSTPFNADIWHNFALQVSYSSNKVSLYHSVGGSSLTLVAGPIGTSLAQSDFHIGNLRVPNGNYQDPSNEWVFYSTVSIQNSLYQPFASSVGSSSSTSSSTSSSSSTPSSSTSTSSKIISTPTPTPTPVPTTPVQVPVPTPTPVPAPVQTPVPAPVSSLSTSSTSSSVITPVPSPVPSSPSPATPSTPSSSSCTLGNQRCSGGSNYQTCTNGNAANYWAASQSCASGLACQSSADGAHIYCVVSSTPSTPSTPVSVPTPVPTPMPSASITSGAYKPMTTGRVQPSTTGRVQSPAPTPVAQPPAPTPVQVPVPAPVSTPSSVPSSSCTYGEMKCSGASTYQTCVRLGDGSTYFAPSQSCQVGLSCHQSSQYVYCY